MATLTKRRVIIVTDGDRVARRAVETAAQRIGARCISQTAGNPTPLKGEEIVDLIMKAVHDPVVIMLVDRGIPGTGKGEKALAYLAHQPGLQILGVLAVASNTLRTKGIRVDFSFTRDGHMVPGPVDKAGLSEEAGHKFLEGDTVEILERLQIPVIIGIGDIGKMDGADEAYLGAEVTTRALREILNRGDRGDHHSERAEHQNQSPL